MEKSPRYRMNEWLKVYLIFGAASFLLGCVGYLTARPQGIATRFAERWSDLTGKLPIANELKWLESSSVPTFTSQKLPVVLLVVPPKPDGTNIDNYPLLENELKKLHFNTLRLPVAGADDWETALRDSPSFYRKFVLIGFRNLSAVSLTQSGYTHEMVIEVNPYLSPELFSQLAAELAKQAKSFKWEQTNAIDRQCLSIEWNDSPDINLTQRMAGFCIKALGKARNALSGDYEL